MKITANVYIDADNVSPMFVRTALRKIEKKCRIRSIEAYGNWQNTPHHWSELFKDRGVDVRHCYALASRNKNAADMTLTVNALSQALTHQDAGAIAIISSDTDYYPLVSQLKRFGRFVIGAGDANKSSKSYKKQFDWWIETKAPQTQQ